MPGKFHQRCRIGILFTERGLLLRTQSRLAGLCAGTMTLITRTVFLDDAGILAKLDPVTWPERHGNIECRTRHAQVTAAELLPSGTNPVQIGWRETKLERRNVGNPTDRALRAH
jgi:hypothetical protein